MMKTKTAAGETNDGAPVLSWAQVGLGPQMGDEIAQMRDAAHGPGRTI